MADNNLHVLKGATISRKTGSGANTVGGNWYPIGNAYASNIGEGDFVKLSAGKVELADNLNKVLGVALEFAYIDAEGKAQFKKNFIAGTSSNGISEVFGGYKQPMVLVADDPAQTYIMRTSDSLAAQAVHMGKTFKVSAIGSVVNGRSTAVIDLCASVGTSGGYMVTILGLYTDTYSEWGVAPNAVEVKLARQGTVGSL